ncbi:hypothetical protein SAMN04244560_02769 [Thermoanaerobacter thermohydrosulfuricus]|uniref:Uncharacterized protein n=1 Tax=Thermoanaerobacter thermohydrosulfuricus TaxID=1516 RepID=A0A1G7WAT7_THETY|nr:hypothetical protein [Thermoanaerobacter thermohydrosulfuricus]SDG69095.1 hypothetical protein SAMN04244560_02769 [Thermoanaerobacter thermohydrosulfuricus]
MKQVNTKLIIINLDLNVKVDSETKIKNFFYDVFYDIIKEITISVITEIVIELIKKHWGL